MAHNFVRFYLQDLMRVDKVVYLDVDIVVQADISALYDDEEIERSGATVCAVVRQTPLSIYLPGIVRPDAHSWMPLAAETFNAGVMVHHLKRWRERDIASRTKLWLLLSNFLRSLPSILEHSPRFHGRALVDAWISTVITGSFLRRSLRVGLEMERGRARA